MPFPLYLLAVAVFAMGTSEFMLAGLLPDIAADLAVTVASAGLLTSAFAVGMVVGAPLVAAFARGRSERRCLLGFLLVFAAAHVVGAVTTGFGVLVGTRVVAALAYAGFLAVGLTAAAAMVPERRGRALAVLLAGTTAAMIAGVPGGSLLGAVFGWRAAFWAVAALCVPAAIGVVAGVRSTGGRGNPGLRAELAPLGRPGLLVAMLLGALVNAGTFAGFTFLAPVVTGPAGLGELWVPVAMVLFGAGSFLGVALAGRLADQRPWRVVAVGGPLLVAAWCAAAALAGNPAALLAAVFALGALSFAVGSTLITRVLYAASAAPTMAGAYATAALNAGATAGPLAGAVAHARLGDLGPLWVSALLVLAALAVAVAARGLVADHTPTA
ncbi:Cmx/CmrA family chloramphenicol efflux MFS transporter [Actinokineospora guangxiensis]|uniref:Cmx/CmrA family chloramphenicol efflux MFS transporter n=1 Tax=Actinokineospora guangxiensis TaxID=1490288 RepID=A0ABW0EVE4_9PSEU